MCLAYHTERVDVAVCRTRSWLRKKINKTTICVLWRRPAFIIWNVHCTRTNYPYSDSDPSFSISLNFLSSHKKPQYNDIHQRDYLSRYCSECYQFSILLFSLFSFRLLLLLFDSLSIPCSACALFFGRSLWLRSISKRIYFFSRLSIKHTSITFGYMVRVVRFVQYKFHFSTNKNFITMDENNFGHLVCFRFIVDITKWQWTMATTKVAWRIETGNRQRHSHNRMCCGWRRCLCHK